MSSIAQLTPYSLPIVGGVTTFVRDLAQALRTDGHQVSVLAGQGAGDRPEDSNIGPGNSFVVGASRRLDELRPEIIHAHGHWYTLAAGARYKRNHPHARLVFSFHTTPDRGRLGRLARLLRAADVVTFISRSQQAVLQSRYRLQVHSEILYPATNPGSVDGAAARSWRLSQGLEDAFPLLAFVGPLEYPGKVAGLLALITSIGIIRRTYPRVVLLVVGDGKLRDRAERQARALDEAVRFQGVMEQPWLAVGTADIYCHISFKEGLPLALLEAMALGRAVLATPAGGIPEVINGRNGLLVDGDPTSIAQNVLRIASDTDLRQGLGREARETVLASFTWKTRLKDVRSLYGLS